MQSELKGRQGGCSQGLVQGCAASDVHASTHEGDHLKVESCAHKFISSVESKKIVFRASLRRGPVSLRTIKLNVGPQGLRGRHLLFFSM
jgi:hypothetical protein